MALIVRGFIEPIAKKASARVRRRAQPPHRARDGGIGRLMSNPAQAVEGSSTEEEPSAEEDTPSSLDGGAVERVSQGAPSWLSERRQHAWSVFEDTPLPSTRSEEWRYTDVSRLLKFADLRVATEGASGRRWHPPHRAHGCHGPRRGRRRSHGAGRRERRTRRPRSCARAARGNSDLVAFSRPRTRGSSRKITRHRDLAARGWQVPGAQRSALDGRRAPLRPPEREARPADPDHAPGSRTAVRRFLHAR